MQNHNWSTFTTKLYIQSKFEKVYQAWAIQVGMEIWFLRTCAYGNRKKNEAVQSGDTYIWTWHTKDNYTDKGKIIETQKPNYFKFTFGPVATCAVSIAEENGATLVKLVQEKIPTDEKSKVMWNVNCQTGWTYFLLNLKAYLEHGIDLRDKDTRRLEDCSEYME